MSWLFDLFRRKAHERRLDSELRFHLEQQTKDNIAAGMSPEMARREAAIALGGLEQIKEECRDERGGVWLGQFSQDLRFGLRMLRKNPAFATIAVLSLALGIGAATSVFSLVDAILLGSLPVPNPQDLRVICWSGSETRMMYITLTGDPVVPGRRAGGSFSKDVFLALRKECAPQADIFAYSPFFRGIARARGLPVSADGLMVSGNFFTGLGVYPLVGSLLGPEDEGTGSAPRVVISYRWWEQQFALNPGAVGQQLTLNGNSYTIAGILPRDFAGVYSSIGAPRLRASQILVAAQIALSLLFVTGAGLYARTLINLYRIDPGHSMDHILLLNLDPGAIGVQVPRAVAYCENVQRSLAAIPGVNSAALVSLCPSGSLGWPPFTIPGASSDGKANYAPVQTVSEDFFSTMGIPILDGRELRAGDRDGTAKVIVVNEAFVRKFFSDRPPVGRMVKFADTDWQVVGVCRDAKYNYDNLKDTMEPTVYFPFRQQDMASSSFTSSFALKTTASPMSVAAEAEKVATAINPDVPATDLYTEEQLRDRNFATERASVAYYGSLATFVLLLSCMGLYGLMAFDVARRTSEFGVRMALGAAPRQIVGPILRMALWLAMWGFAAGLPLTLAMTRFIGANLYGVTASDPATFVGASILLVLVILAAAWIPARRATKVDPMVALRCE